MKFMYAQELLGRHARPAGANMYPDAAMAIAEGHYAGPLRHYQAVGRGLGYSALP